MALKRNSVLYYIHADHLGGTVRVSDAGGNIVDSAAYTAYGQTRSGGTNLPTDRRFTGQTLDLSTGLYWYVSRPYHPLLGRFIQPDTVVPDYQNPQSLNRYTYVLNNPLKYVDPSGKSPWDPEDPGYGLGDVEGEYPGDDTAYVGPLDEDSAPPKSYPDLSIGPFVISLVEQGQENDLSSGLAATAMALDTVDLSITAAFAEAYTTAQIASLGAGPQGSAATFAAFSAAYFGVQNALTLVDVAAMALTATADVAAGRTRADFEHKRAYIGQDTMVSIGSLLASRISTAPGVFPALAVDTAQVSYDTGRLGGRIPGYSWVC